MRRKFIIFNFLLITSLSVGQENALEILLADSSMIHSSASLCIINTETGEPVYRYNAEKSLIPASVMKIITSSAALELLGPEYRFKTVFGYTGDLNRKTGRLKGNIFIKGGGDPSLGSPFFKDHYREFLAEWITEIRNLGIKKIDGRVIADDSRYDHQPVPVKWLWEDAGNYYGAGVYGLSVFDNSFEIHLRTAEEGSVPEIIRFVPQECRFELSNYLVASGNTDKGYIFRAPFNGYGWLAGSVPVNREDFVLKASVANPPLLLSEIFDNMLDSAGIEVTGDPSVTGNYIELFNTEPVIIAEIDSPSLKEIIEVLNHESVNLYAEHLLKEMGKVFNNSGTTAAGIEVLIRFLQESGINASGVFIEDGSGLSPLNSINTNALAEMLIYMRKRAKYPDEFYASLPDAGKEGTLKNYFKDHVFDSNLRAKSGSMTRVRSYAGYFKALSGKELAFCIIINNYSGSSQKIVEGVEGILKETIMNK